MRTTTLLGIFLYIFSSLALASPISGQGTWETTLLPRDINGDGVIDAFYDSSLNITWLRDANPFRNGGMRGGELDWNDASNQAVHSYALGISGWRLPSMVDTGNMGCDLSYSGGTDCGYNVQLSLSEMAHLFYVTLGNLPSCPVGTTDPTKQCLQTGWGLTNTGLFIDMQKYDYWTEVEYAANLTKAWSFNMDFGFQYYSDKQYGAVFSMLVHDGDVGTSNNSIPTPSSICLVLASLIALNFSRSAYRIGRH